MLRSGRFRHRLLETSFLHTHARDLYQALSPFLRLWESKKMTDCEIAAIYVLIFSFFRRPDDFLGGPHKEFSFLSATSGLRSDEVIKILRASLPEELKNKKSLARLEVTTNFVEAFCSFSWRSIPLAVPRSLRAWQTGLYPLTLMTSIPSPEQVLLLQCEGRRCVSMLVELDQIANFVEEGRDVLGFIVHDLIHADHFFADPLRAQAQIQFCRKLQVVYDLPAIQKLLVQDEIFKSEFYYLMSDMNSVPLHLLKTLKAVLLGHFKRSQGAGFNNPLCSLKESEFLELFHISLQPWSLDSDAWEAALRLNTPSSLGQTDALLLDVALNKLS